MTESVIDFPKDGLCPDIWEKVVTSDGMSEVWQLKPDVWKTIHEVHAQIVESTHLQLDIVHITGSITSNSYTENADIDVHFLSIGNEVDESEAERINLTIRDTYKKTFIGKHPIEVYFQRNLFQDLMSVGCYDFLNKQWLVGPELVDNSFNPYSEYYQEIQTKSEELASQIRNMIFSIYEIAIVMKKNIATEFGDNIRTILVSKLEQVQQMYDNIRAMRKVYSSPTSREQALSYRSSRKWKIADASFKLFDKYGYMAILKLFIEDYKLIQISHEVDIEVVDDILDTVKKYINNADKLAEQEMYEDELDEGILSNISLAALLAIPALMPEKALASKLQQLPKNEVKASSAAFQATIKDFSKKMVGKFSETNFINIGAWTLYAEAGNLPKAGKEAIASVILNRAGGDITKFIPKIFESTHFSAWNDGNIWKLVKPSSDSEWTYTIPKITAQNKKAAASWNDCVSIMQSILAKTFKSTIGNRNAYLNKDTVRKTNPSVVGPKGWGTLMTDQIKIGDHTFGYLPEHDGYLKDRLSRDYTGPTQEYVVKKGDSIDKISRNVGLSRQQLVKLNGISMNATLRIGTKLKVPKRSDVRQNVALASSEFVIVKAGDTLTKIANDHNTTAKALALKNNIGIDSVLKIGQKLIV